MNCGPDRLIDDLKALGFEVQRIVAKDESIFAVIPQFEVTLGQFKGRIIDLGIQATPDFPKTVSAAVHVRADPQLFEPKDNVHNVRNITASVLGNEWRYWSKNFNWNGERSARRLVSKINAIFENA